MKKEVKSDKKTILAPLIWPSLTRLMENIFVKRLPSFRPESKVFLVKILPYLALFSGVYAVIRAFPLFQLFSETTEAFMIFNLIMLLVMTLLEGYFGIFSYTKLRNKMLQGWEWFYYATIIGFFAQITYMQVITGATSTAFILFLIGYTARFYITFQIQKEYKN